MNTSEIENVLRLAPKFAPPGGLKDRLIAQLRLPPAQPTTQNQAATLAPAGWLRRWWPVLAPATMSLACAVGLTLQQREIHNLKQEVQGLSHEVAAKAATLATPTVQTNSAASKPEAEARTQQEIARLKASASQLAAEVSQLEQMRAENAKLRTQLEAPPAGFLTPEETEALAKPKERAESIACVNNLKQLGLSLKVWALDNGDVYPPEILSMTNEMGSPKILVCPGDKMREAAKSWASYTSGNCSYEFLAPSAPDTEPQRVALRCPIHGHVCLCDGSVQGEVAKRHPEQLVQRNGKLYFGEPAEPLQGPSLLSPYERRYGVEGDSGQPTKVVPAQPSTNPPPGGSNP